MRRMNSTKRVAVLVVHGIGWHRDGIKRGIFDETLTRLMDPPASVELLEKALAKELGGDASYVVELAHWGKEVEVVQQQFEERYRDLRWDSARRVAISALGDAAQYSAAVYSDGKQSFPTHDRIHATVAKKLGVLADECGAEAPLVVIGHSLGGHILSNHIYDEQQARAQKKDRCHGGDRPLERMETLRAFISFGCNIPLFVMGAATVTPIALNGATWLNYYDSDDILGYPLMPLYFPTGTAKPAGFDLQDIEVEVSGPFTGWNPLSHGGYWDHSRVVMGIAEQIRNAAAR
jgi:hypothetical protein